MTRTALQSLYQIDRGPAAEVTAAISGLRRAPIPYRAFPALDRTDTYIIDAAGYYITYEVDTAQRIVTVLIIE